MPRKNPSIRTAPAPRRSRSPSELDEEERAMIERDPSRRVKSVRTQIGRLEFAPLALIVRMAGYSGTPLPQKLGIKAKSPAAGRKAAQNFRRRARKVAGGGGARRDAHKKRTLRCRDRVLHPRERARTEASELQALHAARRRALDRLAQTRIGCTDRHHRGRGAPDGARDWSRRQQGVRDRRHLVWPEAGDPARRSAAESKAERSGRQVAQFEDAGGQRSPSTCTTSRRACPLARCSQR